MATKTYKDFLGEVLPGIKSCPVPVAVNAIRNAVIDFCERSWAWKYNHPAIDVTGSTGKYAFVPATDTIVTAVLQVWYAGEAIDAMTLDFLHRTYKKWQSETGDPAYYTREDEASITIVPYPATAATGVLSLLVALKPSRASTTCDSLIFENHLEKIAMGARSRLMLMTDVPWSNPRLGAAYKENFEYESNGYRAKVLKGLVRSRQRVTGNFF